MIPNATMRKAMHEIAAKKGDFTFFALIMRADALGLWDLVVSAPWLEDGRLKATSELVKLLAESVGEDALRDFARVATLKKDDPRVQFILKTLPVDDGELRVRSTDLFGFQIDEAVIFRAKEPAADRNGPSSRALHSPAAGSGRSRA